MYSSEQIRGNTYSKIYNETVLYDIENIILDIPDSSKNLLSERTTNEYFLTESENVLQLDNGGCMIDSNKDEYIK